MMDPGVWQVDSGCCYGEAGSGYSTLRGPGLAERHSFLHMSFPCWVASQAKWHECPKPPAAHWAPRVGLGNRCSGCQAQSLGICPCICSQLASHLGQHWAF